MSSGGQVKISGNAERALQRRSFKLLKSPGIDSKESIPQAHVAWLTGTTTLFLLNSIAPIYCSKIPPYYIPLRHRWYRS